jgi:hypothetical protein
MNVDGLQVTANLGTSSQPRYSGCDRESSSSSRTGSADAGTFLGVQSARSPSGTNQLNGTFVGNFRNARLECAGPVLNRVLP